MCNFTSRIALSGLALAGTLGVSAATAEQVSASAAPNLVGNGQATGERTRNFASFATVPPNLRTAISEPDIPLLDEAIAWRHSAGAVDSRVIAFDHQIAREIAEQNRDGRAMEALGYSGVQAAWTHHPEIFPLDDWQRQWFETFKRGGVSVSKAPEPNMVLLVSVAGLAMATVRRRSSARDGEGACTRTTGSRGGMDEMKIPSETGPYRDRLVQSTKYGVRRHSHCS